MELYQYGTIEIAHLTKKDPSLGRFIEQTGPLEVELNPDLYSALVKSIIWQQLSNRAATTIYERLLAKIGKLTPESLYTTESDTIRACGLSARKVEYVREIARRLLEQEVDFAKIPDLSDDEIVKELCSLPGVGTWTAEMLLIFSLGRPNVLSWGDLGIRRGLMLLHRKKEMTQDLFQKYAKKYTPYGTVASFYLWRVPNE